MAPAKRFYGSSAHWQWLYQANRSVLKNPDVIYPGEVLNGPGGPSARSTTSTPSGPTVLTTSTTLSGTLSCPGLEELWEDDIDRALANAKKVTKEKVDRDSAEEVKAAAGEG